MTSRPTDQRLSDLARLRRVRDRIDREYAKPLDVEALARDAHMSAGHLSRQFRLAYGESPYSYLMTRRIERAMALLRRGDFSVTEVCFAVGCASLGTFSTRFTELVGVAAEHLPARGRGRDDGDAALRREAGDPAGPALARQRLTGVRAGVGRGSGGGAEAARRSAPLRRRIALDTAPTAAVIAATQRMRSKPPTYAVRAEARIALAAGPRGAPPPVATASARRSALPASCGARALRSCTNSSWTRLWKIAPR